MTASLSGTTGVTFPDASIMGAIPRSYLAGLTLSTAGSSATFGIAAGQAADSTNAQILILTSAYTKTTSAWAVGTGNGGIDTGAVANSTWYHVFLIKRIDVTPNVVDVLFSLSATAPTMPSGYTLKRRIGSMKTNGSAQWTLFYQKGDNFLWDAVVQDINATTAGTSAVTRTLTVPTGVVVFPVIGVVIDVAAAGAAAGESILLSPLEITDVAASGNNVQAAIFNSGVGASTQYAIVVSSVYTNTSGQIRSRANVGSANTTMRLNTYGWIDRRGRDD